MESERVSELYGAQLAQVHHEHFGSVARNAAAFLLEELERVGLERGMIVELACGGGHSTVRFSEAGYDTLGVDTSSSMIAIAHGSAPKSRFEVASLWDVSLPHAVAVTAIGEAFCYLANEEARPVATIRPRLVSIYDALAPGGILLFDVATPGRSGPLGYRKAAWETDGVFVYLDEREDRERPLLHRTIDSFVPEHGLHRHSREHHRLVLYDPDSLEASLHEIGFQVRRLAAYGDHDFFPGWAAFAARKPGAR